MFNKTQRRKTGGSFDSFITADNNRAHYESGKTRKGIDVKLQKDRSGNPNAWLIGGDAPWDDSFEELKNGAKGGRYKAFIAELFKTYPRFNNFTQSDRGIKLSHAMFCKLFMRDSVLGRMYPILIAKVNKTPQLKCDPVKPVVRANPVVPVPVPVVVNERAAKPVVIANPVVKHVANPVVKHVANPVVKHVANPVPVKPVVPVIKHVVKPVVPVKPVVRDQSFMRRQSLLDPRQSFTRQGSFDQRFTRRQSSLDPRQSFTRQSSFDQRFTRRQSSFDPRQSLLDQRFPRRQSSFDPRQSFPRHQRLLDRTRLNPALQANLNQLTDMGFSDTIKNANALMKHNNNLDKAIDELIKINKLEKSTKYERMAPNEFTTTINLLYQTARKKFTIKNNGGSGDCLFLSLHETLTRADQTITRGKKHHDIRLEIVNYIMTNLNRYQNKTTGQTFKNAIQHGIVVNGKTLHINNYADEMRKQGTYGTDLEISAAAQLYKINIYVVNQDGISFDQLYIGNHPSDWQNTWYIFNLNNSHYTSLLCDDGPGGCPH